MSGHFRDLCTEIPNDVEKRRTKIVCTVGPKTQTKEGLTELIKQGMNVVRMNFSHGSHEFHQTTINNLRDVVKETKKVVGLLLDTKGPEIRTGKLEGGKEVELLAGQDFTITTDPVIGNSSIVSVDYKNIVNVIKVDDRVLIDDGLISCLVQEVGPNYLKCVVENDGFLGETKGANLPNVEVDLPALTDKDKSDLLFGVENGIDFVAASFVRTRSDVEQIREALGPQGASIKIIAKIENKQGIDNFDDILDSADGIMVARGDLGVEIPLEKVALAQKMMISKCNAVGKPVITATQMLETMIKNPRPTRAEATDVANAVFDGTDAVMLSGETAKGIYPGEAVKMMSKICLAAEAVYDNRALYAALTSSLRDSTLSMVEAVASSAVKTAHDLKAALIITITESGTTSRLVGKYRPTAPVFCITAHKVTARQLMLSRGLFPVLVGTVIGTDSVIAKTLLYAKEKAFIKVGDFVVVTSGMKEGVSGVTNLLKVLTVE